MPVLSPLERLRDDNDGYLLDADYLNKEESRRYALIAKVEGIDGNTAADKRLKFVDMLPFFRIFRISAEDIKSRDISKFVSSLRKDIIKGRSTAIAAYLAWLCSEKKEAARELYEEVKLASHIGSPFREFIGTPGDALRSGHAKIGDPPNTIESDIAINPSPPSTEKDKVAAIKSYSLVIIPSKSINIIVGTDNEKENAKFSFSISILIGYENIGFILLGFSAHYIAPNGLYCLNIDQFTHIDNSPADYVGNLFDFIKPIKINEGLVRISCKRTLWPPFITESPSMCNFGDLVIRIHLIKDGIEETVERFFRFEAGGDLAPIDSPRESPFLPDSVLHDMHRRSLINDEELARAKLLSTSGRYKVKRWADAAATAARPQNVNCGRL